jgi:hypothetical protein
MGFHADSAILWLREIAARKKGTQLAKYFMELAADLEASPKIHVGKESGRLMDEILWKEHAPAQAMFRIDEIGVKLPFPKCWIEFEIKNGSIFALLVKQITSEMIVGIAFERVDAPSSEWMIHPCEFLAIVGSIAGRKRDKIRNLYKELDESVLNDYQNQAIVPCPVREGISAEEIRKTCTSMELHFWALYLFLAACKLPEFSMVKKSENGGPSCFEFVQVKAMKDTSKSPV